jgi:hypothetical protein
MTIDIDTLYHLSIAVSLLLGCLLLYGWFISPKVPALGWWGFGMLLIGVGFGLIAGRGTINDALSIVVANTLILLGAGFVWTGTRVFDNRAPFLPALFAGPMIWAAACAVPSFYGSINARATVVFALLGVYTFSGAVELWKGRALPLLTRWPTIMLLGFHGLLFFVRLAFILVQPLEEGQLPGRSSFWFVILLYEVILYEIALAFSFFAMAKERSGQRLVIPKG